MRTLKRYIVSRGYYRYETQIVEALNKEEAENIAINNPDFFEETQNDEQDWGYRVERIKE